MESLFSKVTPHENKVLKNTFLLLALTMAFSALTAFTAIALAMSPLSIWVTLGVYIAILVMLNINANNGLGLVFSFVLTGWLGLTAGPIISIVASVSPMVIINAFIMASIMLVGLSAYAVISGKDFSFMGGFLTIGILVAFVAGLAALFFKITALSLLVSAAFIMLSGGLILWQVSSIVNGGETNYVLAAVTLYVSFYNIFLSLIQLLGYNND
jgi:modulator of FtsH protease